MTFHLPRKTGLRLASYNVQKAFGSDLRRRPQRTLDVIAGLEPDIVALQEADRRFGDRKSPFDPERIAAETGLRTLPVATRDASLGWHGNALLVGPDVTLHAVERLKLPGLEPRGAVRVHLETRHGGLVVIGTHLGLRRKDRFRQAEVLRAALGDLPDVPAVVLGDFNEWRPVGALAPLTEATDMISPGRSFHATRPVAALDRLALKGLTLHDAGVRQDTLARRASDHLPVWADISPSE